MVKDPGGVSFARHAPVYLTVDDREYLPEFEILSEESTSSMREWRARVWPRLIESQVLKSAELLDTDSSKDFNPTGSESLAILKGDREAEAGKPLHYPVKSIYREL